MRVISGRAKGMRLASVRGLKTRPTADRVKEALFNILGSRVLGSEFLDLFAGSGAVGLEALSRGAEKVVWVDSSRPCTSQIKANLQKTRLKGGIIYTAEVSRALARLERQNEEFDLIFLDPPYAKGFVMETLLQLADLTLLKKDGIIIVEASKKEEAPQAVSKLCLESVRNYGDASLLFYRWEDS